MSERELQRIEVLSKVGRAAMTVASAAHVLDLTTRQVQRLLKMSQAEDAQRSGTRPWGRQRAYDDEPPARQERSPRLSSATARLGKSPGNGCL